MVYVSDALVVPVDTDMTVILTVVSLPMNGTFTTTVLAVCDAIDACTPPNSTLVISLPLPRPVPVIVMRLPPAYGPVAGLIEVITPGGLAVYCKEDTVLPAEGDDMMISPVPLMSDGA